MDFLKKFFIPHEGNDFKPHLLRETGILALFLIVIVLFIGAIGSNLVLTRTDFGAAVISSTLVDLANQDRAGEHLALLTVNPVLVKAAKMKADDMVAKSYFAHTSPEGKEPWYWFKEAGYNFTDAGENLAVNFNDSIDVNNAWLSSPGHRANIMRDKFTEIGIATAEGDYKGVHAVYVVQMFGRPAPLHVKMVPVVSTTSSTTTILTTKPKSVATTSSPKKIIPVSTSTPTTTPNVRPVASTTKLSENGTQELFIAVASEDTDSSETVAAAVTEAEAVPQSSFLGQVFASPKKTLNYVFLALAVLIALSLIVAAVVEIRRQHPLQMAIILLILILIAALFYLYQNILFAPLLIV